MVVQTAILLEWFEASLTVRLGYCGGVAGERMRVAVVGRSRSRTSQCIKNYLSRWRWGVAPVPKVNEREWRECEGSDWLTISETC